MTYVVPGKLLMHTGILHLILISDGGKLAEAYAGLMQEMWVGDDKRTAPYDLKKVLGKRVARFSGYGQ